jgi:hypothetical protein
MSRPGSLPCDVCPASPNGGSALALARPGLHLAAPLRPAHQRRVAEVAVDQHHVVLPTGLALVLDPQGPGMGGEGVREIRGLVGIHEDEQRATRHVQAKAEGGAVTLQRDAFDLPGSFGHPITVPVALRGKERLKRMLHVP